MLRHRPFSTSDLQTICSFPRGETELFYFYPKAVYPLTPEQLQDAIDRRSDSTVIEKEGAVVGFANFIRWNNGICHIGNVVVAPSSRGEGVARYLIKTMITLARERHSASAVRVSCFANNTAGLLLYKKLEFTPYDIEERRGHDGRRIALVHMHYPITKAHQQP